MTPEEIFDIHKTHRPCGESYYKVPVKIWDEIVKRAKRRKMNLVLDFTKAAKDHRLALESEERPRLTAAYVAILKQRAKATTLSLWYPHATSDNPKAGEHAATFPEVRTAEAGRKAADTFDNYCACNFTDKTKK